MLSQFLWTVSSKRLMGAKSWLRRVLDNRSLNPKLVSNVNRHLIAITKRGRIIPMAQLLLVNNLHTYLTTWLFYSTCFTYCSPAQVAEVFAAPLAMTLSPTSKRCPSHFAVMALLVCHVRLIWSFFFIAPKTTEIEFLINSQRLRILCDFRSSRLINVTHNFKFDEADYLLTGQSSAYVNPSFPKKPFRRIICLMTETLLCHWAAGSTWLRNTFLSLLFIYKPYQ